MPELSGSIVPVAGGDVGGAAAAGALAGLPASGERWRCSACGNLTRFDVTRTATTREFWHVDLAGQPRIEETAILNHTVATVVCRWCGRDDAIEVVARPGGPPP